MVRMVKRCTRSARRWREQFDVEDEERRACDRTDWGGGERRRVSCVRASAVCVRACMRRRKERWAGRGAASP